MPPGEVADILDANVTDFAAEMPNGTSQQRRERLLAVLRRVAPSNRLPMLEAAFEAPLNDDNRSASATFAGKYSHLARH